MLYVLQAAALQFMAPFFFFAPRFLREVLDFFPQVTNQAFCTHFSFYVISVFKAEPSFVFLNRSSLSSIVLVLIKL